MKENYSQERLLQLRSQIEAIRNTPLISSQTVSGLYNIVDAEIKCLCIYLTGKPEYDNFVVETTRDMLFKFCSKWHTGEINIVFSRAMAGFYPMSSKITGQSINNVFYSYREEKDQALNFYSGKKEVEADPIAKMSMNEKIYYWGKMDCIVLQMAKEAGLVSPSTDLVEFGKFQIPSWWIRDKNNSEEFKRRCREYFQCNKPPAESKNDDYSAEQDMQGYDLAGSFDNIRRPDTPF